MGTLSKFGKVHHWLRCLHRAIMYITVGHTVRLSDIICSPVLQGINILGMVSIVLHTVRHHPLITFISIRIWTIWTIREWWVWLIFWWIRCVSPCSEWLRAVLKGLEPKSSSVKYFDCTQTDPYSHSLSCYTLSILLIILKNPLGVRAVFWWSTLHLSGAFAVIPPCRTIANRLRVSRYRSFHSA